MFVKDCKKNIYKLTLFKSNDENQKIKSGGMTLPVTTNIKRSINYTDRENKKVEKGLTDFRASTNLQRRPLTSFKAEIKEQMS